MGFKGETRSLIFELIEANTRAMNDCGISIWFMSGMFQSPACGQHDPITLRPHRSDQKSPA